MKLYNVIAYRPADETYSKLVGTFYNLEVASFYVKTHGSNDWVINTQYGNEREFEVLLKIETFQLD